MNSSALEVFTDFNSQQPLMLEQSTTIDEATRLIKKAQVRLKLVIDAQESFLGVITLADLNSIKVTRAKDITGLSRSELTIADVMMPKRHLYAPIYVTERATSFAEIFQVVRTG
jgi:predicted transcriptional regulator